MSLPSFEAVVKATVLTDRCELSIEFTACGSTQVTPRLFKNFQQALRDHLITQTETANGIILAGYTCKPNDLVMHAWDLADMTWRIFEVETDVQLPVKSS